MDVIVGDPDCPFLVVCNVLMKVSTSELLFRKLEDMARELGVAGETIHRIKTNLILGLTTSTEGVHEILVLWRSERSSGATLGVLLGVLENCGLLSHADELRKHFALEKSRRQRFLRGPMIGTTTNLQPRVIVICTLDKNVTAEKLQDTTNCSHVDTEKEFLSLVLESPREDGRILSCNTCSSVKGMLWSIGSAVNSNIVLITEEVFKDVVKLASDVVTVVQDEILWSDLSPVYKHELVKKGIKLSGYQTTLQQVLEEIPLGTPLDTVLHGKVLIDIINDQSSNLLVNTIPEPIQYYVPRMIGTRTRLRTNIIFNKDNNDIFLFTGIGRFQLSKFAKPYATDTSRNQKHKMTPTVRYMVLDMKSDFDDILKKATTTTPAVHWIEHSNGKFYWIKSSGNLAWIQRAVDTRQCQQMYNENDFMDMLETHEGKASKKIPVCISDTPGMGKSMLLASLARKFVANNKIVLFGVMTDVISNLKKEMNNGNKQVDIETAAGRAISGMAGQEELARLYMAQAIRQSEHDSVIELMLDGFDEVRTENMELAQQFLQIIKSFSLRLWVTTRPHLLEKLEECFEGMGYNMEEFRQENQLECLVQYWKQKATVRVTSTDRLTTFASKCLGKLHKFINRKDRDIAGVPLQCMLIADVYEEEANKYGRSENVFSNIDDEPEINIRSITDLFHLVFQKKMDKYAKRYSSKAYSREDIMKAHVFLSLQLLFPEHADAISQSVLKYSEDTVQLEDILNVGILEHIDGDDVRFLHRTFAEFLVALFAKDILMKGEQLVGTAAATRLICDVLETGTVTLSEKLFTHTEQFRHQVICYFLDNLLIPPSTHQLKALALDLGKLAHSCVYADLSGIFQYFTHMFLENDNEIFTTTLLFAAARYSELELFAQICRLYEKGNGTGRSRVVRDALMNFPFVTVLHVTATFREYSVVEYLVNNYGFEERIEQNHASVKNLLHSCVEMSSAHQPGLIEEKVETIQMLSSINGQLMENEVNDEKTPLLCSEVHIKLLCELVDLEANVNATTFEGNNVCHLAAGYLGHAEYRQFLQKLISLGHGHLLEGKGGGALQNSVLHQAAFNMQLEPETLELFKKCDADFSVVDTSGDSVLMYAIAGGSPSSIIQSLLALDDANWTTHRNNCGDTVLHVAASFGNVPAIQLFIAKGADVNARSNDGSTPLHHAFKEAHNNNNKVHQVVTTLLENKADVTISDGKGQRPLDLALHKLKGENIDKETVKLLETSNYL